MRPVLTNYVCQRGAIAPKSQPHVVHACTAWQASTNLGNNVLAGNAGLCGPVPYGVSAYDAANPGYSPQPILTFTATCPA